MNECIATVRDEENVSGRDANVTGGARESEVWVKGEEKGRFRATGHWIG